MIFIACVFKKFAEANARWYDAGEMVARNGFPANHLSKNDVSCTRREKWGEHNFVWALVRAVKIVVLNCDLTPIFAAS